MKFDPMNTAFIFAGQGSQAVGMGMDLAAKFSIAKQTFEEADSILGVRFSRIMWGGPISDLNDTYNTQPALYIHSIAASRVFSELYPDFKPKVLAGHSLGELFALQVAGAFSFEDGLRLVRKRGELMKRAVQIAPGKMIAILGLTIEAVENICSEATTFNELVQIANDNCPGQVVISGSNTAIERAIELAKAAGAKRVLPLAMSIAAHSPMMAPILDDWNSAVNAVSYSPLHIPVVGNVSAEPLSDESAVRADIIALMYSRVRWAESVKYVSMQGVDSFVEFGSGSVLSGLVKRIVAGANTIALGTLEDFAALE